MVFFPLLLIQSELCISINFPGMFSKPALPLTEGLFHRISQRHPMCCKEGRLFFLRHCFPSSTSNAMLDISSTFEYRFSGVQGTQVEERACGCFPLPLSSDYRHPSTSLFSKSNPDSFLKTDSRFSKSLKSVHETYNIIFAFGSIKSLSMINANAHVIKK